MTTLPGTVDGEVQRVAAEFARVTGRLMRAMRRTVPVPIGPGSVSALATLTRCGPMRLGDLAVREGVAPPTLTRMVASLEEAGYVDRTQDRADRRAVLVSATPAGRQAISDVQAARTAVLAERVGALEPDLLSALVAALPALEAMAGDEPG